MKKVRMIGFAALGVLMAAMTAAAQVPAAAESATSYKGYVALAAGIGFAIAVFGGAIGQSRIGAAACEGAARNPGAARRAPHLHRLLAPVVCRAAGPAAPPPEPRVA